VAERVLVVVAHPDDMEFLAGGLVARLSEEGADVSELIVTNGERGTLTLDKEELVEMRRMEAEKASTVLGLKSVTFLDYPDGMLSDYRFNEVREKIMAVIRQHRTDTLVTWDPFAPYETHQDHRITGMAATEAAGFANLPLYHPEQVKSEEDLPYVVRTYYIAKHHIDANHIVDITDQIERKIEALCCHRTQMEFLLSEVREGLKALGKPPEIYERVDPSQYQDLVDQIIRKRASAIGTTTGVEYAEEFRLSQSEGLTRYLKTNGE
jgi:LmbE family N-acetylglucosaminyl deacetylase